jgi:hypothetical protein
MKIFTLSALVLVAVTSVSAESAHAWWWTKLDLNSIQGTYNVVIKPDMSLACPDSITVVYNAANATLDSEAFHFSNMVKALNKVARISIQTMRLTPRNQ